MTREEFISGKPFKSIRMGRKYVFVPAAKKGDEPGRLDEFNYSEKYTEYHCNVKSIGKKGFSIYATICGRLIRMRLRFDEFDIL